jgi:membrane-associated phospholipid phosphatase
MAIVGPGMRRAALLLLLAAHAAAAEEADVYRVWPAIDLPVTAALFTATIVPYFIPDLIEPTCPCDPTSVNRLDRVAIGNHSRAAANASDATAALALALPPLADAVALGLDRPLGADYVVFAETLGLNSALVAAAKSVTQRPLPLTFRGHAAYLGSPRGYRSFYSGHTSTVVAALTASAWTMRWRYGEQGWPWVVDALAGVSVGVERVLAGRHFPTDVIAGAAAGFGAGTAVPWLHRRPGAGAVAITVAPAPGGFVLSGRF